ncbi:MAG: hypothetical protein ACTSYB_00930 [Candidatus Helarchaeota archaeon]
MAKIVELNKSKADKEVLKNISDFFYESISTFRRTLNELSVSINHFLKSLSIIEKQLGYQGFDYPANSSELLYERLVEHKRRQQEKYKKLVMQTKKNISTVTISPQIPVQEKVQRVLQIKSSVKPTHSSKPSTSSIKPNLESQRADKQFTSLTELKRHMLEELRKWKKIMKGQLD